MIPATPPDPLVTEISAYADLTTSKEDVAYATRLAHVLRLIPYTLARSNGDVKRNEIFDYIVTACADETSPIPSKLDPTITNTPEWMQGVRQSIQEIVSSAANCTREENPAKYHETAISIIPKTIRFFGQLTTQRSLYDEWRRIYWAELRGISKETRRSL